MMTPGQLQQGQPQRIFIVADIGGAQDFHMGDEAMLEANLQALRNLFPAIEFVATSRDPVWTQHRYAVQALLAPTFADLTLPAPNWDTEPEVRRQTNWLLSEEIVAALRRADALIVSGGGNLCSTWPSKILERVALIHCARDLGKPAVVLGQTLGPNLTTRESALLAGALQRAQLGQGLPAQGGFGVQPGFGQRADDAVSILPPGLRGLRVACPQHDR